MREIKHFNGEEITNDVISQIHAVTLRSKNPEDVSEDDDSLVGVEQLTAIRGTLPEQENILLGQDWFIGYSVSEDCVEITSWYGVDKVENKITQTTEMLWALRSILSAYPHMKYTGFLKELTSYPIYQVFEKNGYIKTTAHESFPATSDVGDYTLHEVEFVVTEKFQKRYCK